MDPECLPVEARVVRVLGKGIEYRDAQGKRSYRVEAEDDNGLLNGRDAARETVKGGIREGEDLC